MSSRLLPRPVALLSALVALCLLAAACSSVTDEAAATVEGTEISQDEVDDELEAITSNEDYLAGIEQQFQTPARGDGEGTFDATFVARVLSLRVYFELIEQELEQRDAPVTAEDVDAVREQAIEGVGGEEVFDRFPTSYQERIVRQRALLAAAQEAFAGPGPEEGEARAVYDDDPTAFESRCLAHILVGTTEGGAGDSTPEAAATEAGDLYAQLQAGADFTTLASSPANDDTTSAAQGGSLDCVNRQTPFDPDFLDAAFAAEVGQVTEPVQTQFGYHLILVSSAEVPPFEEVEPQIVQQLSEGDPDQFNEFLRTATCESDIEVADRYGSWDTSMCESGGIGAVLPPEGPTTTTTAGDGGGVLPGGAEPGSPPGDGADG